MPILPETKHVARSAASILKRAYKAGRRDAILADIRSELRQSRLRKFPQSLEDGAIYDLMRQDLGKLLGCSDRTSREVAHEAVYGSDAWTVMSVLRRHEREMDDNNNGTEGRRYG